MKNTKEGAARCMHASIPATVIFIVLTLALLTLAVRLIAGVAAQQLSDSNQAEEQLSATAEPVLTEPAETPVADDTEASEAAAILVPAAESAAPTSLPVDTPTPNAASEEESIQPPAKQTPKQSVFRENHMDLLLPVFGEDGGLLYLAVLAVRNEETTFLFAPGNLLCADGLPLSARRTAYSAELAFSSVFPVRYSQYVQIDADKVGGCVDALGGLTVAGKLLTGKEVTALVLDERSDALLRIEKMQSIIASYIVAVQDAGLLRLIGCKSALDACTRGNLTAAQYLALYQAIRRVSVQEIVWRILPVDSVISDGVRYYKTDTALCSELAEALYDN